MQEFVGEMQVLYLPTSPARRRQSVQCAVPDGFLPRLNSALADRVPLNSI